MSTTQVDGTKADGLYTAVKDERRADKQNMKNIIYITHNLLLWIIYT